MPKYLFPSIVACAVSTFAGCATTTSPKADDLGGSISYVNDGATNYLDYEWPDMASADVTDYRTITLDGHRHTITKVAPKVP